MKKILNKKVITLCATLAIIMVAIVGTTFAYHSDTTKALNNRFAIGSVETHIEEKISLAGQKDVTIVNDGKNACYIRTRVTISPSNAPVTLTGLRGENWQDVSADGFYYYQIPVDPGQPTTSLFSGYTIDATKEFIPFEVTIYQEAVQASVYDPTTGTSKVNSMTDSWRIYDTGTIPTP